MRYRKVSIETIKWGFTILVFGIAIWIYTRIMFSEIESSSEPVTKNYASMYNIVHLVINWSIMIGIIVIALGTILLIILYNYESPTDKEISNILRQIGERKLEKQEMNKNSNLKNNNRKICPECTFENKPDNKFCEECGSNISDGVSNYYSGEV